jgi:predicted amidophosphoribosyltransferase
MKKKFHQNREQKQVREEKKELLCSNCGAVIDSGINFCGECGANVSFDKESEGLLCAVCGETFTGSFCGYCGAGSKPVICSKCNTVNYSDFCSECGEPLTSTARELQAEIYEDNSEIPVMSVRECTEIIDELNSSLSAEMKNEKEKIRQRIILMKEREYFKNREERVTVYYNSNKKVMHNSIEKLDWIKNVVGALNCQIILTEIKNENERLRRIEEEKKKINGSWMLNAYWGYCIINIIIKDTVLTGNMMLDCPIGLNVNRISGKYHEQMISFKVVSKSGKECANHAINQFSGRIHDSGKTLNGLISYDYSRENGIFVKSS